MDKHSMPPPYSSEPTVPSAPPTYAQAVRGVPPSSPYVPTHACKYLHNDFFETLNYMTSLLKRKYVGSKVFAHSNVTFSCFVYTFHNFVDLFTSDVFDG